jgi:hypothetical protein
MIFTMVARTLRLRLDGPLRTAGHGHHIGSQATVRNSALSPYSSKMMVDVTSPFHSLRVEIALCSPRDLAETGLPICLTEKCQTVIAFDAEQSVLCSPVCLGLTAKYGHYLRILVESEHDFSAVKTEWRSEWDSNLWYSFGPLNPGVSVSCR